MTGNSRKLEGILPEPHESVESFIARGQAVPAENVLEYRPQEGDSLGEYLMRLRLYAGWSADEVATHLKNLPENVALTAVHVARLESGDLDLVTKQRLQVLATLYGVPQDWILQTASYPVDPEVTVLPATDNLYASVTMRSAQMDALDPETRDALNQIFNEIISAVQGVQQDQSSAPVSAQE